MSYSPRYETTVKSFGNDVYTIHIEKLNYTGTTTHISRGAQLTIKQQGSRDSYTNGVYPSLCRFGFWVEEEYSGHTGTEEFRELLESEYKDFRLSIYKNQTVLAGLSSGFNQGSGVSWITGTTPTVTVDNTFSKNLALSFTGAIPDKAYYFTYNFDVDINSSAAGLDSVINWTEISGTGETWSRNAPYNTRWQVHFDSIGTIANELRGNLVNTIANTDYTILFRFALVNQVYPLPLVNNAVFRMYATDDTLIDEQTIAYEYGNGNKNETITFTGNAKVPGYVTFGFEFNASNSGTGDVWLYDTTVFLSGETGTTTGSVSFKLMDSSFNLLDTVLQSWSEIGNINSISVLTSSTNTPAYIAIQVNQDSGEETIITFNSIAIQASANDFLYWRGWVKPDLLSSNYILPSGLLTLDCVDGLNDLKSIEYPASGTTDNFVRATEVIKNCLSETEIPLEIYSQINLANEFLSGNTLNQIFVNGKRFVELKNGRSTYWNLYTVLDRFLKTFNSYLIQANGYWQIVQRNETSSPNYLFDYDTLIEIDNTNRNRIIDINNEFVVLDSDELSKVAPIVYSNIDLINESSGDNEIFNGDLISSSTGWANSTGATAFDNFFYTTENTGYLNLINIDLSSNPNTNRYFEQTVNFNVSVTTGDTITFQFDASSNNAVVSGGTTANPWYKIEYIDTVTNLPAFTGTEGYLYTGWKTYVHKVKTDYTGNIKLRVWVMATLSSGYPNFTLTQTFFDNFSFVVQYANQNAFNKYYTATNVSTSAISKFEGEQYFADTFTATEKASLKYSITGSTSESWTNYSGSVTGNSITDLYSKEIHEQHTTFKDFLVLNIRSLNYDLQFDSLLLVNSKVYSIADLNKDLLANTFAVQLNQLLTGSTPSLVFGRGNYDKSGSGGASGSGGGAGSGGAAEPIIYYPGDNISIADNVISAVDLVTESTFNAYTASTTGGITFYEQLFTSTGQTTFTVTGNTITVLNFVEVNGNVQKKNVDYTISGNTIDFGTSIPSASTVVIHYFETITSLTFNSELFTSTGQSTFTTSGVIDTINFVDVNGSVQKKNVNYTVIGNTIDFGTSIPSGSTVQIHYFST